jgi:hypothetical protein
MKVETIMTLIILRKSSYYKTPNEKWTTPQQSSWVPEIIIPNQVKLSTQQASGNKTPGDLIIPIHIQMTG